MTKSNTIITAMMSVMTREIFKLTRKRCLQCFGTSIKVIAEAKGDTFFLFLWMR